MSSSQEAPAADQEMACAANDAAVADTGKKNNINNQTAKNNANENEARGSSCPAGPGAY